MMVKSKTGADYHVRPFPRMRRLIADEAWLAQRKHIIHGLVEVDFPRRC